MFNSPFEINIPLHTHEPGEDNTVWFGFPSEIQEKENALDWITSPPNFDSMSSLELDGVTKDITVLANWIRSINVNFTSAHLEDKRLHSLMGSILPHFSKAATDILAMKNEMTAISFWEIHLSMEKTLKLLLHQKGLKPPKTHDLIALIRLADNNIEKFAPPNNMEDLLSDKVVIGLRYGEGDRKTLGEAFAYYELALELVSIWSALLERKYFMNNAKFQIRPIDLQV